MSECACCVVDCGRPLQVLVGALLGVALHLYQTRAPQVAVFVDAVVQVPFECPASVCAHARVCVCVCVCNAERRPQIILGFVLLAVDPALKYNGGTQDNINAWIWYGLAQRTRAVGAVVHTLCWRAGGSGGALRLSSLRSR